ncbi:Uncharacterized membrane protein YfcA [Devosia enhydra]|uniref:Probable membrane transporter protein n=1 Tax=Devosia enhydra TaxID=665118 RepID=A0A1K2HTL4_9HYPH|nr:sulfite exporter TauE/SafE family protein [Devosia enhydra]SFZ81596.1 Uncharacterized membrane protein YfcA [Devosia enhydra]
MDTLLTYLPFFLGLVATGAVSGVLAGLLGVGGGAIIVPALALVLDLLGYDDAIIQHVAVASSLAIIIPTGIVSARSHHKRGAVDLRVLRLWAPFILVGTLIGGLLAGFFSGNVLRVVFGVMVYLVAANIVFDVLRKVIGHLRDSSLSHRAFASVIGFLSALMGIGGGSLSVPTLSALGLTMHAAVGTAAALGVAIAIGGTIGFIVSGWGVAGLPPFSLGYISLPAVVAVGVMAGVTAPLGAALAHRLDQKTLKKVFAVFLVLVGTQMLWKALVS